MIEYSKTYRDRIRRKGPLVKATIGHSFEAFGKTKTEAREALEADIPEPERDSRSQDRS